MLPCTCLAVLTHCPAPKPSPLAPHAARELPTADFLAELSAKLGHDIPIGQIRTSMASIFGEDVSTKFSSLLDTVNKGMAGMQLGEEGGEGSRGLFGGLLGAVANAVLEAVRGVWWPGKGQGEAAAAKLLWFCPHAAQAVCCFSSHLWVTSSAQG
jgi:hypothetical protein